MFVSMLLTTLIIAGAEPGPVSLELLASRAEIQSMVPKVELKINQEGRSVTYSGIPLGAILDRRAKPIAGMPGLRDLSDAVLLVRGADSYQAAVSAASVAMDPEGQRYLIASQRDGQSIPTQLIIPGDPKRARWVKDVVAIRLVRLNEVVKAEP